MFHCRGHKDKIFMIKWNPHDINQLVTVGVKHIKFWTQAGKHYTFIHLSLLKFSYVINYNASYCFSLQEVGSHQAEAPLAV